tara:strand:- start:9 stop:161 length:153 start_codon:yes stop_codon:yes gene_type:complete
VHLDGNVGYAIVLAVDEDDGSRLGAIIFRGEHLALCEAALNSLELRKIRG